MSNELFADISICGILAHGFARAYCDECQHDFLIAYSCKSRGVCPSCPTGISFGHNTRRMAETAAHLADHIFPPLPVRQWVLAMPKRLRCFVQRDAALHGTVLRILLCMQGCKMNAGSMIYTLGLERRR